MVSLCVLNGSKRVSGLGVCVRLVVSANITNQSFDFPSLVLLLSDQTEVDCSPGTENSEQHNLLEQLQSRYRQMEERITCPICIDNHIKLVFQCGHASCIDCSAALKTCPICRQTIRERIQLFV